MDNFLVEKRINFENITFPIRIKTFDKKSDLNHSTIIHKTLDTFNTSKARYRLTQVFKDDSKSVSLVQKHIENMELEKNQVHQLRLRGVSKTGIHSSNLSILFFYTDEGEVLLVGEFDEPITFSVVSNYFIDSIKDEIQKEVIFPIDEIIEKFEISKENLNYEILNTFIVNYLFAGYKENFSYTLEDMFLSEKLSFETKEKINKIAKTLGMRESYAFKFAEEQKLKGLDREFRAENVQFLFNELNSYYKPEITEQSEHALFKFVDAAIKEMDLNTKVMEEKLVSGIFRTIAFLNVNNPRVLRDNVEVVDNLKSFIASILIKNNKLVDKFEIIKLINTSFKLLENQNKVSDIIGLTVVEVLSFISENLYMLRDKISVFNKILNRLQKSEVFVADLKDILSYYSEITDTLQKYKIPNKKVADRFTSKLIVSSLILQEDEIVNNRDAANIYVKYIEKSFFDTQFSNDFKDIKEYFNDIENRINIVTSSMFFEEKFIKKSISEIFDFNERKPKENLEKIFVEDIKEESNFKINSKDSEDFFRKINLFELFNLNKKTNDFADIMIEKEVLEKQNSLLTKNNYDSKKIISKNSSLEYEGESCNIMGFSVMGESFMGCGTFSKVVDTVE